MIELISIILCATQCGREEVISSGNYLVTIN